MQKFLTTSRRKAVYGVMTAVVTALVVFGVITQEQIDGIVQAVTSVLLAATTFMAFVNTNPKDDDEEFFNDSYGGTE